MIPPTVVKGTGIDVRAEIGSIHIGSGQGFLKEAGLTVMDSDKRLRCLSLNPTLKFVAMSSSSSSS